MSLKKPTEVEANELVLLKKIISAKLNWRVAGPGWRLKVKASAIEKDEIFDLHAYIGKSNYSFALLYNNFPIRKFTKHPPHRIGKILFAEPHKHTWNGMTDNMVAYIPNDICVNDDINDQFMDFCRECNIEVVGEYQRVAYQIR